VKRNGWWQAPRKATWALGAGAALGIFLLALSGCSATPVRAADSPSPFFSVSPSPSPRPLTLPQYFDVVDAALNRAAAEHI